MAPGRTHVLWRVTFAQMKQNELKHGDKWAFKFDASLTNARKKTGWKIHCHRARGRFRCSRCSKRWTSARAVVLFHYHRQKSEGQGTVIMRHFRQECRHCKGKFEQPRFSKKEIKDVLLCLFRKIRKNCYGEEEGGDEDLGSDYSEKKWTKPHESALCEACSQNICCQNK